MFTHNGEIVDERTKNKTRDQITKLNKIKPYHEVVKCKKFNKTKKQPINQSKKTKTRTSKSKTML